MVSLQTKEGQHEYVERPFGVLQTKWHIFPQPSKLWSLFKLGLIMKACRVLQNMMIEGGLKEDKELRPFYR